MPRIARLLLVGLVALVPLARADAANRPVYLAGQLSDGALTRLGAAVAAHPDALLLIDSPHLSPYLRHFLAAYRPDRVVPVGKFPDGAAGLSRRLGVAVEPVVEWPGDPTGACPKACGLTANAGAIVVCPAEPREQFLRAACLAGAIGAPLWQSRDGAGESKDIEALAREVGATRVLLVGKLDRLRVEGAVRLKTRRELDAAYHETIGTKNPVETVVVVNPTDERLVPLAPWLAVQKRAALLFTNADGGDGGPVVEKATRTRALREVENVLFLADHKAIPVWKRPNPIPKDKDKFIEMEPLTPEGNRPFSYSVGRLFHADRAVIPLMLARQRLASAKAGPRKALVASNPGGGLPLLETFSRHTAQELRNAGHDVTLLAGNGLDRDKLRKAMPGNDLILWEGHHNTLIKDWGFTTWNEPMPPAFVCLQSCLALTDWKVAPLLERGAYAVVGTSTRTYSASGGAFSLAYFNGLTHDGQSLGGSLRQSKNFLIAYASLKQKRLADQATRTGANYRAAWAFSLWGDPTYRPVGPDAAPGREAVRHTVTGNTIVLDLPARRLDELKTAKYTTHVPANARLAGLVRQNADDKTRTLIPMVFAEVYLPKAKAGATPRLRSRLPAGNWVFLWDARRKTGYLLATPRDLHAGELRFRVEWSALTAAEVAEEDGSGS